MYSSYLMTSFVMALGWPLKFQGWEFRASVRLQQCHFESTSLLPENRRTGEQKRARWCSQSHPGLLQTMSYLSQTALRPSTQYPALLAVLPRHTDKLTANCRLTGTGSYKIWWDWIYVMCELKILCVLLVIFNTNRYYKNQSDICVSHGSYGFISLELKDQRPRDY